MRPQSSTRGPAFLDNVRAVVDRWRGGHMNHGEIIALFDGNPMDPVKKWPHWYMSQRRMSE